MQPSQQPSTKPSEVQQGTKHIAAQADQRLREGFAPPVEIYQVQNRNSIDWSSFPDWARPSDPDLFDGCAHEG